MILSKQMQANFVIYKNWTPRLSDRVVWNKAGIIPYWYKTVSEKNFIISKFKTKI